MATPAIQWREPESFVSGDTLSFQRNLPTFLPSDGWAIKLVVTQNLPNGAQKVAESDSTPDTTNSYHVFNTPNFLAGLPAGTYVLTEEVINAAGNTSDNPPIAAGTKHQIYFSDNFSVQDDLGDGLGTAPVLTQNQKDLAAAYKLRSSLLLFRQAETEDLRSRFSEKKLLDVQKQIDVLESKEILYQQRERARNGKNPGNVQEAVFCIG